VCYARLPIRFYQPFFFTALVQCAAPASLYHVPEIYLRSQYTLYNKSRPFTFRIPFAFNYLFHKAVLVRRRYSGINQTATYLRVADAVRFPLKYLTDNRRGFRVNDNPVFVIRVFQITVTRIAADKRTLLLFHSQGRA